MLPKLTPIGLTYLDLSSCLLLLLRGERLGASEDRGRKKRKQCEGGKIWRRKREREKNKKPTKRTHTRRRARIKREQASYTNTPHHRSLFFFSLGNSWETKT
jgi:hypothetical protein